MGMGATTGRGAGLCAGFGVPGYRNRAFGGGGFGRGRGAWSGGFGGGGRGWRNRFFASGMPYRLDPWQGAPVPGAPADPESERNFLNQQAESYQKQLEQIRKRLAEIEPQTES